MAQALGSRFEADQLRLQARRFNPACQPVIDPLRVRLVATLLPQVQSVEFHHYNNDHPIRDHPLAPRLPPQLDPNDNWSSERLYFSVSENTVEIMNRPKDAEALSYLLNLPPIYPPQ